MLFLIKILQLYLIKSGEFGLIFKKNRHTSENYFKTDHRILLRAILAKNPTISILIN